VNMVSESLFFYFLLLTLLVTIVNAVLIRRSNRSDRRS
jgi:hypothetical protein